MNKLNYPEPWMLAKEVRYLDNFIRENKPRNMLEWGSGGSTIHFSKHECIEVYISIEHDLSWFNKVKREADADVILLNNEDYVNGINGIFDMILIDGIKRITCLKRSVKLLGKNGSCFLHDSDRDSYKPYPKEFKHDKVIEGRGNTDGLTRFFKSHREN